MDTQQHKEMVEVLRTAQEIVEEALGASLSGSVARDQILVSLSGALMQDYWDRKYRMGGQPREQMWVEQDGAIARDMLLAWKQDSHSGQINPQETALALTKEMAAQWPGREREWLADTFVYFLKRAGGQVLDPEAPPPDTPPGA